MEPEQIPTVRWAQLEAALRDMQDAQRRCASRMFVAFCGGLLLGVGSCSVLAWLILP